MGVEKERSRALERQSVANAVADAALVSSDCNSGSGCMTQDSLTLPTGTTLISSHRCRGPMSPHLRHRRAAITALCFAVLILTVSMASAPRMRWVVAGMRLLGVRRA